MYQRLFYRFNCFFCSARTRDEVPSKRCAVNAPQGWHGQIWGVATGHVPVASARGPVQNPVGAPSNRKTGRVPRGSGQRQLWRRWGVDGWFWRRGILFGCLRQTGDGPSCGSEHIRVKHAPRPRSSQLFFLFPFLFCDHHFVWNLYKFANFNSRAAKTTVS